MAIGSGGRAERWIRIRGSRGGRRASAGQLLGGGLPRRGAEREAGAGIGAGHDRPSAADDRLILLTSVMRSVRVLLLCGMLAAPAAMRAVAQERRTLDP